MRYLLDTHALIWHLQNDTQLSNQAKSIIEDEENEILATTASLWEIAIKISLKKLELTLHTDEIYEKLIAMDIRVLNILPNHIRTVQTLPHHHRDPFDRMIIAQAQAENCPIISRDGAFEDYDVPVLW
jgi:PIN domain nuclease of toxin-antitoxin system